MYKELIVCTECRAFRPQITHNVEFQTIEIDWNIEKTFVLGHVTLNWVTNEAKTKVSNHRQSSLSSASLFSEMKFLISLKSSHTGATPQWQCVSKTSLHREQSRDRGPRYRVTDAGAWDGASVTPPQSQLHHSHHLHCTTIPGHGGSVGARLGIIVHIQMSSAPISSLALLLSPGV